nr:hypothetical protein [Tanacetum cinerariifolium]
MKGKLHMFAKLEEKLLEAGIEPELNREDLDQEVVEMVSSCKHDVDTAIGPRKYLGDGTTMNLWNRTTPRDPDMMLILDGASSSAPHLLTYQ